MWGAAAMSSDWERLIEILCSVVTSDATQDDFALCGESEPTP